MYIFLLPEYVHICRGLPIRHEILRLGGVMTVLGTSFWRALFHSFLWFHFSRRRRVHACALNASVLFHLSNKATWEPLAIHSQHCPALDPTCLGFLLPEYPESSVFTLLLGLIVRRLGEMTYSISVLKNSIITHSTLF